MKIEDIISVPREFEKIYEDALFQEHKNSRGTTIGTWKDKNGQIIGTRKLDKHGNGWIFYVNFLKDIIWFYLVKNRVSLREEKIAICRFSEKRR